MTSPATRHAAQPSLYDSSRQRTAFAMPVTPGIKPEDYHLSEMKDTQIVSPMYDDHYHPNGGSYRKRSHSHSQSPRRGLRERYDDNDHDHHSYANDTTLSSFLHGIFLSAKDSIASRSSHSLSTTTRSSFFPPISIPFSTDDSPSYKFQIPSTTTISFIFLCSLWYLSSAFSSNTGKIILTQFRYPVTLTVIQFLFVAGYSALFLAAKEKLSHLKSGGSSAVWSGKKSGGTFNSKGGGGWGIKKPTKVMFQSTLVMSLFQIAGHIFSSMAIQRVPVSTVHTIKALSPLFTVASYAALFRVRYGPSTYLALAPLTLGVMLACSFDLRANAVGLICALGSTIIFVSQNIFLKRLLPKESTTSSGTSTGLSNSNPSSVSGGLNLDKLNLLFYSSGTAFVLTIPLWLYSDLSSFLSTATPTFTAIPANSVPHSLPLNFILNGTTHFAQNLLAFSILSRTSPVTYSIASLVKRIAVICLAIIWSGQTVTTIQGAGMGMTFIGLWMYNRAKVDVEKGERKRNVVEKRQEVYLPTTGIEARELEGISTPPPGLPRMSAEIRVGPPPLSSGYVAKGMGTGMGEDSIQNGSYTVPFPTPPASPFR